MEIVDGAMIPGETPGLYGAVIACARERGRLSCEKGRVCRDLNPTLSRAWRRSSPLSARSLRRIHPA
ncbi:protein of unknown function [Hyphomicrobium sp. MC1]|nr:protein of unknown function [Hyphomicrobium sp. MC1]